MTTKASIIAQGTDQRVHLHIVDDGEDRGGCRYQWHRADGESIEVSGATEEEATAALRTAYADDCWRLIVVDHVTARAAAAFGRMGGSVGSPAQRANARRTDRGGGRPATIYIVEIPHQRPVTAYSDTRARIIALSESRRCTSDRPLDLPEGLDMDDDVAVSAAIAVADAAAAITTLGDARCEIGRDLSGVLCYESTTAARRALRDDTQWTGHQGVAARVALREQVERNRR